MKSLKNRYLSLCIVTSLAISGTTAYSGIFSWWQTKAASPKFSLFNYAKKGGQYFTLAAGVVTIVAVIYAGLSKLFGKGDDAIPAPKIKKKKIKRPQKNISASSSSVGNPEINQGGSGGSPIENGSAQNTASAVDPSNIDSTNKSLPDNSSSDAAKNKPAKKNIDIPDYLNPYVVKVARHRGIKYVQLKTVNQFNNLIRNPLMKKFKTVEGENANCFHPNATCPTLSIRNAHFLNQFLMQNDPEAQVEWLNKMKDKNGAGRYITRLVNKNKPTSLLTSDEVRDRLENCSCSCEDKRVKLSTKVAVLDAAEVVNEHMDEFRKGFFTNYQEIAQLKGKFNQNDNCFHVFIVNTGDMYDALQFGVQRTKIETKLGCKITDASFEELLKKQFSDAHFYVIALHKTGEELICYIVDTVRVNDHLDDTNLSYYRDRYLCENILFGDSKYDYNQVRSVYQKAILKNALERKILKASKSKKKRNAKDKKNKIAKEVESKSLLGSAFQEKEAQEEQQKVQNPTVETSSDVMNEKVLSEGQTQ